MISIDLSETAQKKCTGNPRQCLRQKSVRDKIENFFSSKIFSDKIFFQTKNCQSLSWTEFCLELDFFSDYIPQLYFVCNHLIYLVSVCRIVLVVWSIAPNCWSIAVLPPMYAGMLCFRTVCMSVCLPGYNFRMT